VSVFRKRQFLKFLVREVIVLKKAKKQLNKTNFSNEHGKKVPYQTPNLRLYGRVSQLTSGAGGTTTDGGSMPHTASDRRTKENVVLIGKHWLGFGLYLFNYKPEFKERYGQDRQFGVMADEVETIMPSAVTCSNDGYKMVYYEMLGISQALH